MSQPTSEGPPPSREQLATAIFGLRIELLGDATEYGLALVLATGTPAVVPEWREWIEWGMAQFGGGPGPVEELDSIVALEEFERTGERDEQTLTSDEARARWAELLELLSSRVRAVEQLGAIPLGEEPGQQFGEGVALLGMLEDALAIEVTDNGDGRPTAAELLGLLKAAREEGVWDFLAAE